MYLQKVGQHGPHVEEITKGENSEVATNHLQQME